MTTLDLTSIILSCITLATVITNAIFSTIKRSQYKDNNNDIKQWETIDKLITGLLNKQEEMCKTLTKMFRRIKKMEENI